MHLFSIAFVTKDKGRRSALFIFSYFVLPLLLSCSRTSTLECPQIDEQTINDIVFVGDGRLLSISDAGGLVQEMVVPPGSQIVDHPLWSRTGEQLAFGMHAFDTQREDGVLLSSIVCVTNVQTGRSEKLPVEVVKKGKYSVLSWFPDEKALLLRDLENDSIAYYDLTSHTMRTLSSQIPGRIAEISVSPWNDRLALVTVPETSTPVHRQLVIAKIEDFIIKPLAEEISEPIMFNYIAGMSWSPDGTQLLFTVSDTEFSPYTKSDTGNDFPDYILGVKVAYAHEIPSSLWLIDSTGNNARMLVDNLDDPRSAWSPDGKKIAYVNGSRGGVYLLEVDSLAQRRLTEEGNYGGIAWRPNREFALELSAQVAGASSWRDGNLLPEAVVDGNLHTGWGSVHETVGAWIEITLPTTRTISQIALYSPPPKSFAIKTARLLFDNNISFGVEFRQESGWHHIKFDPILSRNVKLLVREIHDDPRIGNIYIAEFKVYGQ